MIRGSNFWSVRIKTFLAEHGIEHVTSSAYHTQSQGALEHFHQTMKAVMRSYFVELLFGHAVRGHLKIVKEKWLAGSRDPVTPASYVLNMRKKVCSVCDLARVHLKDARCEMKLRHERQSKVRSFAPGDEVIVLLPLFLVILCKRIASILGRNLLLNPVYECSVCAIIRVWVDN